jgi:hypothetical protein
MTETETTAKETASVRKTPEQAAEDAWMRFKPALLYANYALQEAREAVGRAKKAEKLAGDNVQRIYRLAADAAREASDGVKVRLLRERREQFLQATDEPAETDPTDSRFEE